MPEVLGGVPKRETNCGYQVAINGKGKKKKRIVASKLPKSWGGNQCNNFGNGLEEKKLWQLICGHGIAETGGGILEILAMKLPKMRGKIFFGNGIVEMEPKKKCGNVVAEMEGKKNCGN